MTIGCVENRVSEWAYRTGRDYGAAEEQVDIDVRVTDTDGQSWLVPAYWCGDGEWRVRFSPPKPGEYTAQSVCTDPDNPELHGVHHQLTARPYRGERVLAKRGPIRLSPNGPWFEHADGHPFFWLGDTWWMAVTERLVWPQDFHTLVAHRKQQGFTVAQLVIGFFSDMPLYDPRGQNLGGFPWTPEFGQINPGFFDQADLRVQWLVREDVVPCILGGWGYVGLEMGVDRIKRHWRYLVARYSAYPVIWTLAGETLMAYYLSENKEADIEAQKQIWSEVARYVRKIDPFRRPLTTHPSGNSRGVLEVDSRDLLDFDMVQGGQNGYKSLESTARLTAQAAKEAGSGPSVMGEACYEGIRGGSREEVQRFLFWSSFLGGSAGITYGANGIWQVNQRDRPFGLKPEGRHPGNTPWDEAYRLPGAQQWALAKRFLERYPWWQIEPRQDLVDPAAGGDDWWRPYCGAVDDTLRLVYLPGPVTKESTLPVLHGLDPSRSYSLLYFDPVTGEEDPLGSIKPDKAGDLAAPKPKMMYDCVFVAERD